MGLRMIACVMLGIMSNVSGCIQTGVEIVEKKIKFRCPVERPEQQCKKLDSGRPQTYRELSEGLVVIRVATQECRAEGREWEIRYEECVAVLEWIKKQGLSIVEIQNDKAEGK